MSSDNSNNGINTQNKYRSCSNCGYRIPDEGALVCAITSFTNDYIEYANRILAMSDDFRCARCGILIKGVSQVHAFIFAPLNNVFIFFPSIVPNNIAYDSEQEIQKIVGQNFVIESSYQIEVIRKMAFEAVLSLVNIRFDKTLGLKNQLRGSEVFVKDLLSPPNERNKAYHIALYLTSSRSIGFVSLTDVNAWDLFENARHRQTIKSFFDLYFMICEAGLEYDPLEKMNEFFIPELFDKDVILHISDIISRAYTDCESDYTIESMLAASAAYGHRYNPRSSQWIQKVISLSMHNQWPSKLRMNRENLKKTIPEEDLFNELNKSGLLDRINLATAFDIVNKSGYHDDVITSRLSKRTRFLQPIENPNELLDSIESSVKKKNLNERNFGLTLSYLFDAIDDIDQPLDRYSLLKLILDRYGKSRQEVIIIPVSKVVHALIDDGEIDNALLIISEVEEIINWNTLTLENKITFLTAKGNIYKSKFDYDKSLSCYQDISSLIGKDMKNIHVQVNNLNIARVLIAQFKIAEAKTILVGLLPHVDKEQKFDCLFNLGISHVRSGEFHTAQRYLNEAKILIDNLPMDNTIASFNIVLFQNQSQLGMRPDYESLLSMVKNDYISARFTFLALGILTNEIDFKNDRRPHIIDLQNSVIELAAGMNLDSIAHKDAIMTIYWCKVLINIGKVETAAELLDIILKQQNDLYISLLTSVLLVEILARKKDWDKTLRYIIKANNLMMSIVRNANHEVDSYRIMDTMNLVRNIAHYILVISPSEEHYEIVSAIADLQSSLSLSIQLASSFLPEIQDSSVGSKIGWKEIIQQNIDQPIQILQFMDAGSRQVPIFSHLDNNMFDIKIGTSIETSDLLRLSRKISNRLMLWPTESKRDPFETLETYLKFKKDFKHMLEAFSLDNNIPLLVIPSSSTLRIPFHHILNNQIITYVPSLSIALALHNRAKIDLPCSSGIGEVVCWKYDDDPALVKHMQNGAKELQEICTSNQIQHESIEGISSTKKNVAKLLQKNPWIKLNCHGLAKQESEEFALLLSDGNQNPPDPNIMLDAKDAQPFLFRWDDLLDTKGSCKFVFSTACASGSGSSTIGGEQIGIPRALFRNGVLAYVAPLWPISGKAAEVFINKLISSCILNPDISLGAHVRDLKIELQDVLPNWIMYGFVIHGYHGQPAYRKSGLSRKSIK